MPHFSEFSDFEPVTLQIPSGASSTVAQLQFPLDHLDNMWLLAYSVSNPSAPVLRVRIGSSRGLRCKQSIDNMSGGPVLTIFAGPAGSVNYTNLSIPRPLFEPVTGCGVVDVSLSLEVTDVNGAAITHTGIVLWLAAKMKPSNERVRSLKDSDSLMAFRLGSTYIT